MMATALDEISSPAEVKALSLADLGSLAERLRLEIVETTAINGGHLATNLGAVELTIALHRVFDSPRDRILWDVGNQCYAHKMLTGRRHRFTSIRKKEGLSGFVNRHESPHDHLTAGHAGTALSAALGMAAARDHLHDNYSVVAVVGDGAMSAGTSYEALNNLCMLKSQLLVVLNDNGFFISPSCGGFAQALEHSKNRILDGTVFEALGVTYLGPVDGHDLPLLLDVLTDVKRLQRPVVLHVITQKGKGYQPAESDPEQFHGVCSFDPTTGSSIGHTKRPTYSQLFGREMVLLAEKDRRIIAITAAMSAGTGLAEFAERWPERVFDVGIAEQHAVTFAAGLAAGGCRPVVAIYSTFLQRSYDQIVHDVCLQDLPVTFVVGRAGLVGDDGPTHHGVFDYAYLRGLPRMVVMAPRDGQEFQEMLRLAVTYDGPVALRTPRGPAPSLPIPPSSRPIAIGEGELIREGRDVGLVAIGSMVARALNAAEALEKQGVSAAVVNARFVKPLDALLIPTVAREVRRLFTLEEHSVLGGFGSAVTELLAHQNVRTPVSLIGLPDRFIGHGSVIELMHECGVSTEQIIARVLKETTQ